MKRMHDKSSIGTLVNELMDENEIELKTDSFIKPASEGLYLDKDFTMTFGTTQFNATYAHIRVSNGKLNIVISITHLGVAETASLAVDTSLATISLPSEIASKLVPAYSDVLCRANIDFYSYQASGNGSIPLVIALRDNNLLINVGQNFTKNISEDNFIGRIEFNFIL